MLYDFVGSEKLANGEMEEMLLRKGKRYGLGWFKGRDGELHCGVDEEDLVGAYRHGRREREVRAPWEGGWQVY